MRFYNHTMICSISRLTGNAATKRLVARVGTLICGVGLTALFTCITSPTVTAQTTVAPAPAPTAPAADLPSAASATQPVARATPGPNNTGQRAPVEQRIEHIRVEDSGSVIEELRVGGEIQSMTVRPKGGLPPYQINPVDGKNRHPSLVREGFAGSSGERVWKVLSF